MISPASFFQLYSYLFSYAHRAYEYFLFILAPPFCVRCKKWLSERRPFCVICERHIRPIVSTSLDITASHQMKVYAISYYAEPLKTLILAKSYGDSLASLQLGDLVWEKTVIQHQEFDVIVPVPLHWLRFAKRGFNQAHEMARIISAKSGKPIVCAVKRVRSTPFQSAVAAVVRRHNVKHAFELIDQADDLRDKHILIVDDVMTTGATLHAVARELLKSKPASITAVVACRTR